MMLTLMLTSKGVAAVPRASLVILSGALAQFGLPLQGVAVILGVDALMDMARTSINLVGNCLATVVMARWEGTFDLPSEDTPVADALAGRATAGAGGPRSAGRIGKTRRAVRTGPSGSGWSRRGSAARRAPRRAPGSPLPCDLRARHRAPQPMLEALAQRRALREHAARERHRRRGALVAEQLARQRAHVQHEFLHGEAERSRSRADRPPPPRSSRRARASRAAPGVACAAHAISSCGSFTCAAVSTAPMSAVSGSRPSAAAVTTLSARRPIHAPLPSSPQTGPQPPQRATSARRARDRTRPIPCR